MHGWTKQRGAGVENADEAKFRIVAEWGAFLLIFDVICRSRREVDHLNVLPAVPMCCEGQQEALVLPRSETYRGVVVDERWGQLTSSSVHCPRSSAGSRQ